MEKNYPFKIIIADDDYDDRETLGFLFNNNEMFEQLACFDNGQDVLDEILENGNVPDLLLIDRHMPFVSGLDLIEALQQQDKTAHIVHFVISTAIDQVAQEKYIGNKRVFFLKKPATLTEINDLPGVILECLNEENNTKI